MKQKQTLKNIFHKTPISWNVTSPADNQGISTRILSKKGSVFRYNVEFSDGTKTTFIGKRKSAIILAKGAKMLAEHNIPLFLAICMRNKTFGFQKGWKREAYIYQKMPKKLRKHLPLLYGADIRPLGKTGFLAMEEFSFSTPVSKENIYQIIDGILPIHNHFFNQPNAVKDLCINRFSAKDYKKEKRILKKIFDHLGDNVLSILGEKKVQTIHRFADRLDEEAKQVSFHQTLTHNDFSNRNIAVTPKKVIFYDWELATFQNPEHDIVELVLSVMDDMSPEEIKNVFTYHKEHLPIAISEETYRKLLRFNLLEFCIIKLSLIRGADIRLQLNYANRIAKNIATLMDLLNIEK
ncbi:MAG: hypothetical protein E7413_03300 [Ruminococcaceae bacterium]|nr:hypothetical protein [Oscillospiraceae bacterium]